MAYNQVIICAKMSYEVGIVAGRKPKEINLNQLKKLVKEGWDEAKICSFFGCKPGLIKKKHPGVLKIGRPPKSEFSKEFQEIAGKMAGYGCTDQEIADVLMVSLNTLRSAYEKNPAFSKKIQKFRGECKRLLRAKQLEIAIGGSEKLLIWLGKQFLGQAEKQQVDLETKGGIALIPETADDQNWAERSQSFFESIKPK